MSDLPKSLRAALAEEWRVFSTEIAQRHQSPDGTDKVVLRCSDGRLIECVLMHEQDRRSICISTQVGCGMGCVFCASGLKGVERNLTKGEILEQVVRLRNYLSAGESLTNIVVMGMGESLAKVIPRSSKRRKTCSTSPRFCGEAAQMVVVPSSG